MKTNRIEDRVDKLLNAVFTRMFKIVGLKFSRKTSFDNKEWYLKKSLTKEQEEEFKKFFVKEHIKCFKSGARSAEKDFSWFNLSYGWKRND